VSSPSFFDRRHLAEFSTISEGQPELAKAFFAYYGQVFQDGELSGRQKSLTALAVAHAVQCPYCIDAYTRGSLEAGADLEQMTEAVHVAAAVRSTSVMSYGLQMLGQAAQLGMGGEPVETSPAYFARGQVQGRGAHAAATPELWASHEAWAGAVFRDGGLEGLEKHLIGLACAHAIQCPYAIEHHTRAVGESGGNLGQMTEAVHVANAIRGGAALVHGLQMKDLVAESAA
jgi:alkylhydroperoxidase/carboxymuconolactone decarboxylase family protein